MFTLNPQLLHTLKAYDSDHQIAALQGIVGKHVKYL